MSEIISFPLCWPVAYPRQADRRKSTFKITPDKARKDLLNQIYLISGDTQPIVSSNVPLRKSDGQMYADVANDTLHDPGVAVYFIQEGERVVIACDAWVTPAENIRSIGLTIDAMRGLKRWECTNIMKSVFVGLKALPEFTMIDREIWETLGLTSKPVSVDIVKQRYRAEALIYHPDKATHDAEKWDKLNKAYKLALSQFN